MNPIKYAQQAKAVQRSMQQGASPATAAALDLLRRESTQILQHMAGLLTKCGKRQDSLLARVHHQLAIKYGHPQPIELAVDAIRPVIRYYKPKNLKVFVPEALWPRTSIGMALRWIVKGAEARTYGPWKLPNLERGLLDEIDAILMGTSGLFARKLQCHKNPN